MSRPARIALIACAVVLFALVSAGVARVLSANSAERAEVERLVVAQAAGDADRAVKSVPGCAADPRCVARMRAIVRRVASPGTVAILRLDASTTTSLAAHTGTARVAWKAGRALPVVQCVRVRRAGDVVSGFEVSLLRVSAPIARESSCPGR
ncbi:MAG: hypothetical protein U0T02_04510 [Solirubrobacteraceae bacterium]